MKLDWQTKLRQLKEYPYRARAQQFRDNLQAHLQARLSELRKHRQAAENSSTDSTSANTAAITAANKTTTAEAIPTRALTLANTRKLVRQLITRPAFWLSVTGVAALTLAIGGLVFNYYYQQYARIIDARMSAGFIDRTVDIYAAPIDLAAGEALTQEKLVANLKRFGYQRNDTGTEAGSYHIADNSITITALDQPPNTIKLEFNGNKIKKIVDLTRGGERDGYSLPGLLLGSISDNERYRHQPVNFAEIPKSLVDATMAIEDRRFYEHPGIDYRGIFRALWINYQRGEVVQGGSTLTQQLIKTILKKNERTFQRKFDEAFLSLALERHLSKQEIFALYANEVFMGQQGDITIRGFGEAAQYYFGKDLKELTLAEAAMLAGLIRGPSYYSPTRFPERATARRIEVLQAMLEMGAIDQTQFAQAKNESLTVKPPKVIVPEAPYFLDYASAQLKDVIDQLPSYGRYRATLSLDLQLQQEAEDALNKHLDRLRRSNRNKNLQAALIALDPRTGDLLAMVGGRDYGDSHFNRATTAMRQPGSAFKPFVYTVAFQSGQFSPASMVRDEEQTFTTDTNQEYKPKNHGDHFSNSEVTLRQAFARSLNTVTVDLAQQVGLENIADLAARAGLPKPKPYLSMALGTFEATPLEMAAAYAVFANGGTYRSPRTVRSITDKEGHIVASLPQVQRAVCSSSVAYLMTDMMQSVIREGTATYASWLQSYSAIAGKTGTSSDGWFVGYSPKMVVAVWVGNDDNRDIKITGGQSALPIWADFMKSAFMSRPDLRSKSFPWPSDVHEVKIDADTGYLASEFCNHVRTEIVINGLEPRTCDHSLLAFQQPGSTADHQPSVDHQVSDIQTGLNYQGDTVESTSTGTNPLDMAPVHLKRRPKHSKVLTNSDFQDGNTYMMRYPNKRDDLKVRAEDGEVKTIEDDESGDY